MRLPFPLRSESLLGLQGCGGCPSPTTSIAWGFGFARPPRASPRPCRVA